MNEAKFETLKSGDSNAVKEILNDFLRANEKSFQFPALSENNLRSRIWESLFDRLENDPNPGVKQLCLANIRVLSRDKTDLDELIDDKLMNSLIKFANLTKSFQGKDREVTLESLKCLCNLMFNSNSALSVNSKSDIVDGIISRVKSHKPNIPYDIKYFDMRLLFIVTALCDDLRDEARNDIKCLVDYLNDNAPTETISDDQYNLTCEILKTLYNLIMSNATVEREIILKLIAICNRLFQVKIDSIDKKIAFHSNIVHILTCIPYSCYLEIAPIIKDNKDIDKKYIHEGRNMETVHCLLNYLQNKLSITPGIPGQSDNLSPILTLMHRTASSCSFLRKYLRSIVLPPLKDVHSRPEEGNTLRNHLCRLLTSPVTHVRDLAAQFLFILCKENVNRMIKYTGYGNAAGLFATQGLLGVDRQNSANPEYSSDSEDSDTEEYSAMKHTINPVIGCYEPPRSDPMAGCSEEQKEYEAMKLVNLIDQLNRAGVIQPCRVGADGRPEPVDHVLQLQEDLPNQQVQKR